MRRATFVLVALAVMALVATALEVSRKHAGKRDQADLVPAAHPFGAQRADFRDNHFKSSSQNDVTFPIGKHLNPYATATYKEGLVLWHGSRFRFETANAHPDLRGDSAFNRFLYNPTWFSGLASTSLGHGYMTETAGEFFLYKLKTNRDLKIALIPHQIEDYSFTLDEISDYFLSRRALTLMLRAVEKKQAQRATNCIGVCKITYKYTYKSDADKPSWENLMKQMKAAGRNTNVYDDSTTLDKIRADLEEDLGQLYDDDNAKLESLSDSRKQLWRDFSRKLNVCYKQFRNPAGAIRPSPICQLSNTLWTTYQSDYRIMGAASGVAVRVIKQSVFCKNVQGWRAPWDQNEFVLCPDALDSRWYQIGFPLEITNRWKCNAVSMCSAMRRNAAPALRNVNCQRKAERQNFLSSSNAGGVIDYFTNTAPYDGTSPLLGSQFDENHADFTSVCVVDVPQNVRLPTPLVVF